jgi:uncharacterized phage infection (PIP) family protein YhgE
MKRIIVIASAMLVLGSTARAQWTVYDPAVHAQQIISTAQEIAKFVEMINNQVQQIEQLTEQVETLHHYVELFGDPATFAPASINALTADLTRTELGQTLTSLQSTIDAVAAMSYTGHGLFSSVAGQFTTPNGTPVERREEAYRPVAAVQRITENYLTVSQDAAARRAALKQEIARTTQALRVAQTDAEVQKLTGVLVGLAAALDGADHELQQAATAALVQDVANRADERRQAEARREEQHAEFTEAVQRYGQKFRLLNTPTEFPVE